MKDTQQELERIQEELLSEETAGTEEILDDRELDELLNDSELNDLLWEQEKESAPQEPVTFQNFANSYGAEEEDFEEDQPPRSRDDKVIVGLMATASVLSLGIIGVLAYWLTVLL